MVMRSMLKEEMYRRKINVVVAIKMLVISRTRTQVKSMKMMSYLILLGLFTRIIQKKKNRKQKKRDKKENISH